MYLLGRAAAETPDQQSTCSDGRSSRTQNFVISAGTMPFHMGKLHGGTISENYGLNKLPTTMGHGFQFRTWHSISHHLNCIVSKEGVPRAKSVRFINYTCHALHTLHRHTLLTGTAHTRHWRRFCELSRRFYHEMSHASAVVE